MFGSVITHPLVLLLAALAGPFVAVAAALLLAGALGWVAGDRRRSALVVGAIAGLYFGLALLALGVSSRRGVIVYGALGVLWTGLAWYNRLGPGSRSEDH